MEEVDESMLWLRFTLFRVVVISSKVPIRSIGVTPTPTSTVVTPLVLFAPELALSLGLALAVVFALSVVGSLLVCGVKPKPIAGMKGEREKENGEVEDERAEDDEDED